MDGLTLILLALAVYRLAYLIALEDGPADLALRLRQWAWRRWGVVTQEVEPGVVHKRLHVIPRGLACPLCVSFWLSLPAALLLDSPPWPLGWLGLAGAVLVLHRGTERS